MRIKDVESGKTAVTCLKQMIMAMLIIMFIVDADVDVNVEVNVEDRSHS